MEVNEKAPKPRNLAVAVDPETFKRINWLAEKLGESKRQIVRRAVGAMHIVEATPRVECRPSGCCSHGTDGEHDE